MSAFVYEGRCAGCESRVAGCIDGDHRADTAEFVHDMIRDGLNVNRVAAADFHFEDCKCPTKAAKP